MAESIKELAVKHKVVVLTRREKSPQHLAKREVAAPVTPREGSPQHLATGSPSTGKSATVRELGQKPAMERTGEALSSPVSRAPPSSQSRSPQGQQTLTEERRQGGTPLRKLVFGRLQMFTGTEYFGFLFFFFWIAIFRWLRRWPKRTVFDSLLFAVVIVYCIVIMSGVRNLSWSNPRYIGSLMLIGAYFSGPLLARLTKAASPHRRWRYRMGVLSLIVIVSFPA